MKQKCVWEIERDKKWEKVRGKMKENWEKEWRREIMGERELDRERDAS